MLDQTALVKAAHTLEPLPASVSRLAQLLVQDDWSIQDAEAIIALDQTLTARLLRLANSAASGSRAEIAPRSRTPWFGWGPAWCCRWPRAAASVG